MEMKKMTATAISHINSELSFPTISPTQKTLRRWIAGLFVSAFLGTVCGLDGIVITVLSLVGFVTSGTALSTLGTLLIAASFPLFLFASHCLDKVDAAGKASRLEYCRQHGLKDEDS